MARKRGTTAGAATMPSAADVHGLDVHDVSGMLVGRVADAYVDRDADGLRYLIIEADERPDRAVVVPADQVRHDEGASAVVMDCDRERFLGGPTIDLGAPFTRDLEADVYGYWGVPGYWEDPRAHEAGYMRPEREPVELHGAGYMRPDREPAEVRGAGWMDPRRLEAVKLWRR